MSLVTWMFFISLGGAAVAACHSAWAVEQSSDRKQAKSVEDGENIPLIIPQNGKGIPLKDLDQRNDVPARTVFFELNQVERASSYSIQVKAVSQHWADAYTANVDGTTLRLRLTPGKYVMRTRSFDENAAPGKWGGWKEFWVHFRAPAEIYPANHMTIIPKGNNSERVTFEWPGNNHAKYFVFSLYNKAGEMIQHVRTPQTWLATNLALGTDYAWRVVPLTSKDEPEPPDEPLNHFRIDLPNTELRGIKVQIAARQKAASYDFEFLKFINESETSEPTVYNSKESNYKVSLGPGEYEMRARVNYDDGTKTNWTPPQRFWVGIANPVKVTPAKDEHIDPTDDIEAQVKLKWKPAKEAIKYRVYVWDDKDHLIEDEVTEKHYLKLGLKHNTKYKWSVLAIQARERNRKPASVTPEDVSTFKIDRYKRLNLNAGEEPSQVYVWGRYLTSIMSYQASNYDNNTRMQQSVYGGTGELALGYWHRKSNFGALLAGSESGFTTTGKTYIYSYASLMLGYRMFSDENSSRWRIWGGMAYKETPEILKNPDTKDLYFAKIKAWTPEVRVSYLGQFIPNYGYQIYASYLTAMTSIATINGLPLKSLSQSNIGAFVTYRVSTNMIGMIGYSYQVESVSYRSADSITNGLNTFSFSGHYLSLNLQMGLEKPLR